MKILTYQGIPSSGDVQKNLLTIETISQAAQHLELDVIVFPELFVTGYNIDTHLHVLAEPLDGPLVAKLQQIAIANHIAIVTGFPERAGHQIYNSALAIDANGKIVGHHRKVFLFGEKERQCFMPGDDFSVFSLNGYTCGISICYDIEFPESTRVLAQKKAEIIFNPTANMAPYYDVPKTLVRARALENSVLIVYANLCGHEGELAYTGLSAIIAPDGRDLARAGSEPTTLIVDVAAIIAHNRIQPTSTQIHDLLKIHAL